MINAPEADQTYPPVTTESDHLFVLAMALNHQKFYSQHFDDAYHALLAALHLAEIVGGEDGPLLVERRANEQWAWINQHAPKYQHSCSATARRGQRGSTWEGLALMAHMRARALAAKSLSPLPKSGE